MLRVLLHTGTAYACFAVNVVFMLHMMWQLVVHALLFAPHLALQSVVFSPLFLLAALRAVVVAGVGSAWAWFSAWGQMLFVVAPIQTTSQFTLRAAPRWGRYTSVAAGIACNVALQVLATVLVAVPSRGDGYAWRNSWRRATTSWVLLAVHGGLVLAVFAGYRGVAARRGSLAGTQLLEGPSAAGDEDMHAR
eukprot:jgi/Ulvmu1/3299/UM153_0011.1